jgi:hypothetical protein
MAWSMRADSPDLYFTMSQWEPYCVWLMRYPLALLSLLRNGDDEIDPSLNRPPTYASR